ncbi:hypothetical protein GBA52_000206 [Prunus armeniaca]|nr:hypothetical protein GBA52_000206 [Prunus armeniaca]
MLQWKADYLMYLQICPSLLIKKDRGRPTNPKARPKAYGEVNILNNVPGVELLEEDDGNKDGDDVDEASLSGTDDDLDHAEMVASSDDEDNKIANSDSGSEEDSVVAEDVDSDGSIDDDDSDVSGDADDEEDDEEDEDDEEEDSGTGVNYKVKKRKVSDFDKQLNDADASLRALKRLAKENMEHTSLDSTYGKEGCQICFDSAWIVEKGCRSKSPGFRIPNSDELSIKRVDPAKLEVHVKKRMSKEERLALVRAGREDRGKYQSCYKTEEDGQYEQSAEGTQKTHASCCKEGKGVDMQPGNKHRIRHLHCDRGQRQLRHSLH